VAQSGQAAAATAGPLLQNTGSDQRKVKMTRPQLRHDVLLAFGAPCQLHSLVGQGHGLPLVELVGAANAFGRHASPSSIT
jgi:hypothetical protein